MRTLSNEHTMHTHVRTYHNAYTHTKRVHTLAWIGIDNHHLPRSIIVIESGADGWTDGLRALFTTIDFFLFDLFYLVQFLKCIT